jgi:hypothetical protein
MPQKRVGLHGNPDKAFVNGFDFQSANLSNRVIRAFATRCLEGGKIMLTQEVPSCSSHSPRVERHSQVPAKPVMQSRRHGIVQDPILIPLLQGALPGMKALGNFSDGQDNNVLRKKAVQRPAKGFTIQAACCESMSDLPEGVHSRVGPSCTDQPAGFAKNPVKRLLRHLLNRDRIGLKLPPVITGPFIFQVQAKLSHEVPAS